MPSERSLALPTPGLDEHRDWQPNSKGVLRMAQLQEQGVRLHIPCNSETFSTPGRSNPSSWPWVATAESNEQDARLMEFLDFVAMHGCGQLDLETAASLLESVGWDVVEAFLRFSETVDAVGSIVQDASPTMSPQRETADRFSDFERLRLQQEGIDRGFAESEGALSDPQELDLFGEIGQLREEPSEWHANHVTSRIRHCRHALRRPVFQLGRDGTSRTISRASGEQFSPESTGSESGDESEYFEERSVSSSEAAEDDEARLQALLNALIQIQEETDLQDALQLSAEETYSGGFNVPPADEVVIARCTHTCVYGGACADNAPGQCAVCLSDFEPGEVLRVLQCFHHFHKACVDQWFVRSAQCPVCKRWVGL